MAEAKQMMVGNQLVQFKDAKAREDILVLQQGMTQLIETGETMVNDVDGLVASHSQNEKEISQLKTKVSGIDTNISKALQDVAKLTSEVTTIDASQKQVASDFALVKTTVSNFENQLNNKVGKEMISSDINEVSADMVASSAVVNQLYNQMQDVGVVVIDSLDSESTTSPLSANAGRIVNEKAELNASNIATLQTAVTALDGQVSALGSKITIGTTLPETLADGQIFLLVKE